MRVGMQLPSETEVDGERREMDVLLYWRWLPFSKKCGEKQAIALGRSMNV